MKIHVAQLNLQDFFIRRKNIR